MVLESAIAEVLMKDTSMVGPANLDVGRVVDYGGYVLGSWVGTAELRPTEFVGRKCLLRSLQ